MTHYPTLTDVHAAAARIKPYVHRTPVLTCTSLNDLVGAALFCKCENFQKVGAFKFRGACNAVFAFSDQEARHGVATELAAVLSTKELMNVLGHSDPATAMRYQHPKTGNLQVRLDAVQKGRLQ